MRNGADLLAVIVCFSMLPSCGEGTTSGGTSTGDAAGGDPVGGPCGLDCDLAIPHGTGLCDSTATPARCVVDTCEDGYVLLGDSACVLPPDVSCKPCASDDDCYGGTCTTLAGDSVCVGVCASGTCPTGYDCTDIGGGVERCLPASGGCSCTDATEGQNRACEITNGSGTCFGLETCDPATGWSGCTAATPEVEACDGVDNDCNGLVDDGASEPVAACEVTNAFGTCAADWLCSGNSGWICPATTPQTETCNNQDDNCDGNVDEGPLWTDKGTPCTVGTGACEAPGLRICDSGDPTAPTVCSASAGSPGAETCNGIDDDCDGGPDNNLTDTPFCTEQDGVCLGSTQRCQGAAGYLACTGPEYGAAYEPTEISCDGLDNDCDGAPDNNLPTEPCAVQSGVCAGSVAPCNGASGWGSCGPAEYGADYELDEITCDHLDNDCDGSTDEGFVDTQGSGMYDTDTTCGNCYTDCTTIYARPNATGHCIAAGSPICVMFCDPGFFDLNGIPVDGCELQLQMTAIYVSAVDGTDDGGCGLGPLGTGHYPCESITEGINRAYALSGRNHVLVAAGLYAEEISLSDGISVYGGYNPVTWGRNIAANVTTILGANTAGGHNKAVRAEAIGTTTRFDGFTVIGESASGGSLNSYAVYVRDSNASLSITNNTIIAGNGGRGSRGMTPNDGTDGADGTTGGDCIDTETDACVDSTGVGGPGGANLCATGAVDGGSGATTVCPGSCTATSAGNPGMSAGGGAGGGGGSAASNWVSVAGCASLNSCGNPNVGGDGGTGEDGGDGAFGAGCPAAAGDVSGNEWLGDAGANGLYGTAGGGGGGGGAGGGLDNNHGCSYSDFLGGAGGGGGGGGCGAGGGSGGTAGGGSFGIFVVFSTPSASLPSITGNSVFRGLGGDGGDGGMGGVGGLGGAGALGGSVSMCAMDYALGVGGRGGNGGAGGHGGGGGGGCGGVSFGIYSDGHAVTPNWGTTNSFGSGGAGGAGGLGGASLGESGTGGAEGASGNTNL